MVSVKAPTTVPPSRQHMCVSVSVSLCAFAHGLPTVKIKSDAVVLRGTKERDGPGVRNQKSLRFAAGTKERVRSIAQRDAKYMTMHMIIVR